jgi:hypothetical protein
LNKINYKTLLFLITIFSVQIWIIKLSLASIAMIGFVLSSLLMGNFKKLPIMIYPIGLIAILSAFISNIPFHPDQIQYSPWFAVLVVVLWIFYINLSINIREVLNDKLLIYGCYLNIIFCIAMIAFLTPDALISQVDGQVGLFNEKGLAGYYLASISCLLISIRRSWKEILTFVVISIYVLFILRSGRSIFYYMAVILLYVDKASISKRIYLALTVIAISLFISSTEFASEQFYKIELLMTGEGGVGRYAAALIISMQDAFHLFMGNGFGSYLSYRAYLIPLEEGLLYDYPGSLILELFFEVGVILTLLFMVIITKFVFKRISITLFLAMLLLCFFGGKQDVQLLSGLLFAQYIYQKTNYKYLPKTS